MITLDESNDEPVQSTGFFIITLDRRYPSELWEFVEDVIADRLAHMNLHGSIENTITGNTTAIQKQSKGKL